MVLVFVTAAAVAVLLVGVPVGWAVRGRVARWCPVHGEPLLCHRCRPAPAMGRATVPGSQPAQAAIGPRTIHRHRSI